jgi:hypothetical protein
VRGPRFRTIQLYPKDVPATSVDCITTTSASEFSYTQRREEEGEALPQMNDGQSTTHPEPDPAPFKVHLLTRAGRVMRARSEPVRAFSNKDEAVRFAGRQLGGHYAVYHKDRKIWPTS